MGSLRGKLTSHFKVPTIGASRKRHLEGEQNDRATQDDGKASSKYRKMTERDVNGKHDSENVDDEEECVPMSSTQLQRYTLPGRSAEKPLSSQASSSKGSTTKAPILKQHSSMPGSSSSALSLSETNTTSTGTGQATYYSCMYREPQYRKHKSWEHDGYVKLLESGPCKLYDLDTKRHITSDPFIRERRRTSLMLDKEYTIGNREVYITGLTTYAKIYGTDTAASKSSRTTPQRTTQTSSFKKPSSTSQAGISQSTKAVFTKPVSDLPADAISSSSFYSTSSSQMRQIGLSSLTKRSTSARSLYDPVAEPDLIAMTSPDVAHQARYNAKGAPVVDVHIDPKISAHLRPHQIQGIRFLYDAVVGLRKMEDCQSLGAILADDMGLGKTLQTIAVIQMLLRQNCYYIPNKATIERALIVCPVSLVKNWKNEFLKWTGKSLNVECVGENTNLQSMINGKYDVLIINYDKARIHSEEIQRKRFGLLVCDEAHKLKSKDSKTTEALEKYLIDRKILLTGTPIQNNLSEYFTMIDFIAPKLLTDRTTFKTVFEIPIARGRMQHCLDKHRELADERSNALRLLTKPLVLRRESSILQNHLPDKYEQIIFCSPSKSQMQVYNQMANGEGAKAVIRSCQESGKLPLEGIMVLRKLCNSPDLLVDDLRRQGNAGEQAKAMLGEARDTLQSLKTKDINESGKMTLLIKMLRRIFKTTEDKVVVVSNFTATLDIVEQFCRAWKFPLCRLDGKTKQSERMPIVNKFNRSLQDDTFVLLLSSKAGGTGLNLIGANRLILLDNDWNPASDAQAMARIHREGQKKTCFIYRLLLTGTMDEKIFQRQLSKTALSNALMDNEGKNTKLRNDFAQDELHDIFRFHADTPCLTHDMLSCSCAGCGRRIADDQEHDDESDDEEDEGPPSASFRSAAEALKDMPNDARKNDRRKLQALLSWTHHDFSIPGRAEETEDPIIQQLIASQSKRVQRQESDAYDPDRFDLTRTLTGSILYAFAKKSGKVQVEAVDTTKHSSSERDQDEEEG